MTNINSTTHLTQILFIASEHRMFDLIEYIYTKYSECYIDDTLVIEIASEKRDLQIVELLCRCTKNKLAALGPIIRNGYLHMVKYLHESGVDIDSHHSKVLELAVSKNNLDIVKYLCENVNASKINFRIRSKNRAIVLAIKNGYLHIAKYLLDNGADIHKCDTVAVIADVVSNNDIPTLKFLLQNNVVSVLNTISLDKLSSEFQNELKGYRTL